MPVLACRSQHKKLAEGSAYEEVPTSVMYSENDISNSIKNGILYLEDPVNHVSTGPGWAGGGGLQRALSQAPACLFQEWYPHYFVLTSSKIYYSEETSSDPGNEDEEEPKEVGAGLWPGAGLGATARSPSVSAVALCPAGQRQHRAALQREVVPWEARGRPGRAAHCRAPAHRVLHRDRGPRRLLPRARERDLRGRLHALLLVTLPAPPGAAWVPGTHRHMCTHADTGQCGAPAGPPPPEPAFEHLLPETWRPPVGGVWGAVPPAAQGLLVPSGGTAKSSTAGSTPGRTRAPPSSS